MICEIKHYPNEPKPYALWVNNEYIGDYETIQEAVKVYEKILKSRGEKHA